ncbi:hypothetical protein LUZ61_007524 [Rhynchospora tenuis]|uniref:KIB1-4 beta-propeller domain-containing protein n=1 Tax=Rhynchospora tenuis TaxID=198213 RepID=A0AAD5ZTM8_9POAL|nr:hypothetical protein LUZ61_007524 [Rhynchospora tenuis]
MSFFKKFSLSLFSGRSENSDEPPSAAKTKLIPKLVTNPLPRNAPSSVNSTHIKSDALTTLVSSDLIVDIAKIPCFKTTNFISDKLQFEFDEPSLHGKLFIGSQYGWLTVLDQHSEPTLLNPWTGELISLPSVTTLPKVRPRHSVNGDICSYFSHTHHRTEYPFDDCAVDGYDVTFKKVLVSTNPSISSSNFFAAALVGGCQSLVISRPGESRWNLLREKEWYMDIMFRQNGKLICLTYEGAIHEVELKDDNFAITEMTAPFIKETIEFNMYLAEDCAGRVHIIYRTYEFETGPETSEVKVFRLAESKWEHVKNLDGQTFFVGTNASISLAKQDICGEIKADTIYFTEEWWDLVGPRDDIDWPRDICSYSLMSDSIEPCCPDEHRQCLWPSPVWIHLPNHT